MQGFKTDNNYKQLFYEGKNERLKQINYSVIGTSFIFQRGLFFI